MNIVNFDLQKANISASPAFLEASAEELRVLVILGENPAVGAEEAAKRAGISLARAKSAIAYWQAALGEEKKENIIEEFGFRLSGDDLDEMTGKEAAELIRDERLSALFEECARLIGKPALSDTEIRSLAALYAQYGLDADYILTLLSDMAKTSRPTVRTLCNRAIRLHGKEITTVDALSAYFREREETGEWERRARKAFGIYSRALTAAEKKNFRKWVELFGYGDDVLTLAYDKTVGATGKMSVAYMDKILTVWHENGLLSAADCRAFAEAHKSQIPTKDAKEKPRYGVFDPEETLNRALARSMGDDKEDC